MINHPDCNKESFFFVQNAIGTLLGWPEWYVLFVHELKIKLVK
jgi:hypothetical protein